jgi:hypothetical protein
MGIFNWLFTLSYDLLLNWALMLETEPMLSTGLRI